MAEVDVIAVPFNSSGIASGRARGPGAIVRAGTLDRVAESSPVRLTEVPVDPMRPVRGPTGFLAEDALVTSLVRTADAIGTALTERRFPLVIAGDCPMLLGGLEAIRKSHGRPGLMFVDGHEDAWQPHVIPTGEASDCEMAIALGDLSPPPGLGFIHPAVAAADTAFLGARDRQEILDAGWHSIADRVPLVDGSTLSAGDVADIAGEHAARLRDSTDAWWLHVDLDVLSTEALPAVDYPQPGGLSWEQLEDMAEAALGTGGCVGASVVIYNPDLDPLGTGAERIARFAGSLARGRAG